MCANVKEYQVSADNNLQLYPYCSLLVYDKFGLTMCSLWLRFSHFECLFSDVQFLDILKTKN